MVAALAAALSFPPVAAAGNPVPSPTERKFVGLLNQARAAHGLAPVEISPALTKVADDYVAQNVFLGGISHDRDPPFTARAKHAGCGRWSGPVLAQGYAGPAEVLRGWLDSPGHRVTLLDPENTHIGPGFMGEHALAYVMPCTPAQNTSGDFGAPTAAGRVNPGPLDPGAGDPDGSLALSFTRPRVRGRRIYTRVRVRAGLSTVGPLDRG